MSPRIEIRPAMPEDHDFVASLMDDALSPYYGGDHRAHAERIFNTHIAGGRDHIGHFSVEQRMFIAEVDGIPAGMIHLVAKRQGTFKISPLIVASKYRGSSPSVGHALLSHAERYARERGARQMYCTVAKNNELALRFFLRHTYVPAGHSDSHYKLGQTEVMLYKLFVDESFDRRFDSINISVLPFEDRYEPQVRELVLGRLPEHFQGIDDTWVNALLEGFRRRMSADINLKYKLLFMAIDREDRVLGVAGATPKKGEPIKIMPFLATTLPAFVALLTDIPHLLKDYGRKLYIHLSPSADETIALQQRGWQLCGAMPAAYHTGVVTQQWGFDLDQGAQMRIVRLKKTFLDLVRSGQKTLEVRVAYESIRSIRPGETIHFMSREDGLHARVVDVRRYTTFAEMIKVEDPTRVAPHLRPEEVLPLLREIYPPEKESLGVVVLELAVDAPAKGRKPAQ